MVDVDLVLRQMEGAGTRLQYRDSGRMQEQSVRRTRASRRRRWPCPIRAPEGTLLSYATQPGNVALDGDDGHSPYTRALVETMQKPGLDVLQAFNQVGLVVKRATGSAQQPWVSTSPIDGAFYFSGNAPAQVAAADRQSTMLPLTPNPPPLASPVARTQPDLIFPDSDSRHLSEGDSASSARKICGSPAMKSLPGAAATSMHRT